jgi:myo-inositol-1(or 4)-monophosphatase
MIRSIDISKQELRNHLALAIDIAHEAGNLLLEGFEQEISIDQKSSAVDWVTKYDRASEKLIVDRLLSANPDHGIVGEEGSRKEGTSGYKWYIDPLDATNNYAHRFPIFAVSIALYFHEIGLVGVVYDPIRKETFTGVRGDGSLLITPSGKQNLAVSSITNLQRSLIATGFPYDRQTSQHNNVAEVKAFVNTAQGIRRPGCAALDMVYVAAGRLDGYWEYKLFVWDMAAARVIVEESGGDFTKPDGQGIILEEKLSVLVSNGHIHDQMLQVLAKEKIERNSPEN